MAIAVVIAPENLGNHYLLSIAPEIARPRKPSSRVKDKLGNPYIVDPPEKPQKIKIELADGKERELEHVRQTTF